MKSNPTSTHSLSQTWKAAIGVSLALSLVALLSGSARAQALSSGGNFDGTIQLNQTNTWTFSAAAGDRIVARIGGLTATNFFNPWLRIYNPNGVLIAESGVGSVDDAEELAVTATNNGTFTVLVSDGNYGAFGGTGAYRLYFAQFPGAFVVPAGDAGGPLTNGVAALGTIQVGELDLWRFTSCRGDYVAMQITALTQTNYFNPWLRLYGPDGVLIGDSGGGSTSATATLALTVTNAGAFTVLISDGNYGAFGGSGAYQLTSNGLGDGPRLCIPAISGTNGNLSGVGGASNATFVLFTHTNVSDPFALWTPIQTNHFDSYGLFTDTNLFNPADPRRFFRLRTP